MSTGLVIGIIAGVVVLIVMIWFISTWNRLVRLEENVNKSWADIDVLLKQRYDMIPNLVNIVKGYAKHEREIFEQFALARQTAAGCLAQGDIKGVGAAEGRVHPEPRRPVGPRLHSRRSLFGNVLQRLP